MIGGKCFEKEKPSHFQCIPFERSRSELLSVQLFPGLCFAARFGGIAFDARLFCKYGWKRYAKHTILQNLLSPFSASLSLAC